jgi:hypothetical protein
MHTDTTLIWVLPILIGKEKEYRGGGDVEDREGMGKKGLRLLILP